jgi:hypothetical protein
MNAIDLLHELLHAHDGPATRDWLKKERVKLQPATPLSDALNEEPKHNQYAQAVEPSIKRELRENVQAVEPNVRAARAGDEKPLVGAQVSDNEKIVAQPKLPITALLATVSGRDATRLSKEDIREGRPKCLSFGNDVGSKAVLLVCAKIGVLPSLSRAIESLKFGRCSRIYLLSEPATPNVTDCDALAIYERGGLKLSSDVTDWPSEKNPISLADRLLADVTGRRVHLFAKSKTPGWESIIGEENWQTEGERT